MNGLTPKSLAKTIAVSESFVKRWATTGFDVWHLGGISRAWRKLLPDGGYILVTDVGGYDLPEEDGPFLVWRFASDDQLVGDVFTVHDVNELSNILTIDNHGVALSNCHSS